MENASKALLMSATVLISVMVISLGTYLFATFGTYSKNINKNLSAKQTQEFNAQFTKYEGGDPCTVYDIVTVINLAKNSNNQYEEYQNIDKRPQYSDSNTYIYVNINKDTNINELSSEQDLNNFISSNNTTMSNGNKIEYQNLYTCTVNISNQTGLVKSITFTKQ